MNIEQQEIINHALSSKENLEVALAVCGSYDELKKKIIKDFSAYLEHLLKDLGFETDFSDWNNRTLGSYTGFSCYKSNWHEGVKIRVEAQNGGYYNYIFGLKDNGRLNNSQTRSNVFNKCNNALNCNGSKSPPWIWYKNLPNEYKDFDNAKTFFALHDKKVFADYLLAEIEKLGAVLDSELAKTE